MTTNLTTKKIEPAATVAEQKEMYNKIVEFGLWKRFLKLCPVYDEWWKNKNFPKQISSSIEGHLLSILFMEIKATETKVLKVTINKENLTSVFEKAEEEFGAQTFSPKDEV